MRLNCSKASFEARHQSSQPDPVQDIRCFVLNVFLYHLSGWLDCVDMRSAMYGRTVFSRCHRRSRAVKARGLLQRPPGGGNEMPRIGWSVLRNHDAIMP